jgi:hypothetical protein
MISAVEIYYWCDIPVWKLALRSGSFEEKQSFELMN